MYAAENRSKQTALIGVNIVDARGGEPVKDAVLVMDSGRIAEIVPRTHYSSRPGTEELALHDMWVTPGLIDAHVHLAGGRAGIDDQELGVIAENRTVRAMRSVYEAQALLKHGFTTVRDVSWNGLYLKRIFFEQKLPGPKIVACGPGLTRTGGHGDLFQFTPDYVREHGAFGIVADGEQEIAKTVRYLLREGADAIKIFLTGGDNWPHDRNHDIQYSARELAAAVEEAHRQTGTIVMCHAESREAMAMAVEAGVDTIEHGEDLDADLAKAMAASGTILVPTLQLIANWHRDFMPVDDNRRPQLRPDAFLYRDLYEERGAAHGEAYSASAIRSFQLALASGVKIALGSDTVYEPLTPFGEYSALEFRALVEHGMTVQQAITAATVTSSEAVGMSHVIGTVEVGKQADLLVLRQDPTTSAEVLADPANIHLTFCDGKLTVRDGRFAW